MKTLIPMLIVTCSWAGQSLDVRLSLLRGEWEFRGGDSISTLSFLDDHSAIVDGRMMVYVARGRALTFISDSDTMSFTFEVSEDILTLTNSLHYQIRYLYSGPHASERTPDGWYVSTGDSEIREIGFFDGRYYESDRSRGWFRLRNDSLILADETGSIERGFIERRWSAGIPASITFGSVRLTSQVVPSTILRPELEDERRHVSNGEIFVRLLEFITFFIPTSEEADEQAIESPPTRSPASHEPKDGGHRTIGSRRGESGKRK